MNHYETVNFLGKYKETLKIKECYFVPMWYCHVIYKGQYYSSHLIVTTNECNKFSVIIERIQVITNDSFFET